MPARGCATDGEPTTCGEKLSMGMFSFIGRLMLDTSDFQAGAKRVESTATGMARKVSSDVKGMIAGAFTVGAITSFTKSVINAGDRIGDLAEQYHLTNEEVQRLEILAGKTGVKFEKFGESFIKFADIRQKAIDGDAKSLAMLNRYGVSQGDVVNKSKTNLDLLTQISDAYSEVSDSSQAQADALDIAGAKGQKVLSTLTQIKNLGPVKLISDEDITALGEFNDALDEVLRQSQVAAAPALGFWGQVMKRANELKADGSGQSFSIAFFEEMFGWNPNTSLRGGERTGAITAADLAAAREKMTPYGVNSLFGSDNPNFTREGRDSGEMFGPSSPLRKKETKQEEFKSNAASALQNMGGYWFGAVDSSKQDLAAMRADIKRIADSVNQVANQ